MLFSFYWDLLLLQDAIMIKKKRLLFVHVISARSIFVRLYDGTPVILDKFETINLETGQKMEFGMDAYYKDSGNIRS